MFRNQKTIKLKLNKIINYETNYGNTKIQD